MKRSCSLLLFSLILLSVFLPGGQTSAQTEEGSGSIISEADYVYGQAMRFRLRMGELGRAEKATLFLRPHTSADTFSVELPILSEDGVDVEYTLDLTQTRLPPFANITYWWKLERTGEPPLLIPEQTIAYVDDQFTWQTLSYTDETGGGVINVHWTGDNAAVGETALALVKELLPRLGRVIPLSRITPFDVYVYPSSADLAAALRLTGRDWQPDRSYPELGVALTTAVNPETAAVDLRQSLSRELTRQLLYQAVGQTYYSLPAWVPVGLAAIATGGLTPADLSASGGDLPSLDVLCGLAEPLDESAGAAAASLMRFLNDRYGNQAVRDLVTGLAAGRDCPTAVQDAFGASTADIDREWRASLQDRNGSGQALSSNLIWLALLAGGFGLAALLVLRPRRRE